MLKVCNVSYYYTSYKGIFAQKKYVLERIDLHIKPNMCVGIMGESGGGKSTLAKIVSGILSPKRDVNGQLGEVRFDDKALCLSTLKARRAFYRQVQILFQDSIGSLNPRYSCLENCIEPLSYLTMFNKEDGIARIKYLAQSLDISQDVLSKHVAMISGGEAQRICLIRALSTEPKLLILDESLSGLDYELALNVIDFLRKWQHTHHSSILLITHNVHLARKMCDEIYLLKPQESLYRI